MSKLGKLVQDKVTGMKGIATQVCVWMNGCVQYFVEPKIDKEGKAIKGVWTDGIQLKVIGKGLSETLKIKIEIGEGPAGGFRETP